MFLLGYLGEINYWWGKSTRGAFFQIEGMNKFLADGWTPPHLPTVGKTML